VKKDISRYGKNSMGMLEESRSRKGKMGEGGGGGGEKKKQERS